MKAGRNDLCPCGSGKKYKRCCQLVETQDANEGSDAVAPEHELDQRLVERMLRFARLAHGDGWHQEAAAHYSGSLGEYEMMLFIPWALYNDDRRGSRLVDEFLAKHDATLTRRQLDWLETQRRTPISIWEVTAVDIGSGLHLEDRLTGETCRVQEVSASRILSPRLGILARVGHHRRSSLLLGSHPRPLPPESLSVVVAEALARIAGDGDRIPDRQLLLGSEVGNRLVDAWEAEVARYDSRPPPQLQNTDGDELEWVTQRYTFEPSRRRDVEAALERLRGIQRRHSDGASTEFSIDSNRDDDDRLGSVVIARVEVRDADLVVETNSKRRADAVKRRVERVLGSWVTRAERERRSLQTMLAQAATDEPTPASMSPPELAHVVREMKERHYSDWVDRPLPALNGHTPRQAAADPRQREALATLISSIEHGESRLPEAERFDVAPLRRLLRSGGA